TATAVAFTLENGTLGEDGAGKLTVNGTEIELLAEDTLQKIADKITEAAPAGFTATVNTDGRLHLANTSGTAVVVGASTGQENTLTALGLNGAGVTVAATTGTQTGTVAFDIQDTLAADGNLIIGSSNIKLSQNDSL